MTLAAFADLCAADPKWVQNAARILGLDIEYTESEARRIGLLKRLHEEAGITLERGLSAAGVVLAAADAGAAQRGWIRVKGSGVVALEVDVARYLSDYEVRRASVRAHGQPKRRGRPLSADRSAVERARSAGVEVSSLRSGPGAKSGAGVSEAVSAQLEALSAAGVEHVVVGGVAATVRGGFGPRDGAPDVDICYADDARNRRALASLLAESDAALRGVDPATTVLLDERTLRDVDTLPLTTRRGAIDLFRRVTGIGGYAECRERSREVEVGGVVVRVLDLDALIESSRATGRARDHRRVLELEAVKELRAANPADGGGEAWAAAGDGGRVAGDVA